MSRAEEEEQPVVPPDAELIRNLLKSMVRLSTSLFSL